MKFVPVATLLAVAACSPSTEEAEGPAPVALVSVASARPGSIEQGLRAYGAAEPDAAGSRTLSAPLDAVVIAVPAPAGTHVAAGQTVLALRPSSTQLLDTSKAASEAATATAAYARAVRLQKDGLASRADVETSRAAASSATATVVTLRQRANSAQLRSPVSGWVSTVAVTPGAMVTAGSPVATVTSGSAKRARLGITPNVARSISPGTMMRITASGLSYTVPVLSVDLTVDPATKLASVFARLPDQARIGIGEPISGEILIPVAGLVVPYGALLNDGGKPYVFVVNGKTAHRRDIALGTTSADWAAVKAGLKPGEIVVTQGGTALEDGMRVRTR